MYQLKRPVEQTDPPRPARETLPTMYDLPSDSVEESGLPDEYHYLQPQLLSATLRLSHYASDQVFSVGDMNLYYDVDHPLWYKRPDWFAVAGVPRLYEGRDMRLSYVVWQERVNPFVVVELLSPGTEKEDLGQVESGSANPPTKWQVYEQILRVPYYILFDRYASELRAFQLVGGHYQAVELAAQRVTVPEWKVSIGVWQGVYQGVERLWLRWYDTEGQLILIGEEEAALARAQAQQAEAKAARLAEQLRALGIEPED